MMTTDFDDLSQSYADEVQASIGFIGQDLSFFTEAKARHMIALAGRQFGSPRNAAVLDVGCGIGLTDAYLVGEFASVHGIDISEAEIDRARENNPSAVYAAYDGLRIPHADDTFEIVFAINVFHHVPIEKRAALMREMARVTRPGGLALIYEHNPFNPLTRLAVKRCSFDADAMLLRQREAEALERAAGLTVVERSYILFFHVSARVLARIEQALKWLPLGAQYCIGGTK